MRVYIPVTVADVERRMADGFWTISPRQGWAVNHQLVLSLPDEDDEGREYIASLTAAAASAAGLALAADVSPSMLGDEGTNGEVGISGVLRDAEVACLLRVDADDEDTLLWFGATELEALLNH